MEKHAHGGRCSIRRREHVAPAVPCALTRCAVSLLRCVGDVGKYSRVYQKICNVCLLILYKYYRTNGQRMSFIGISASPPRSGLRGCRARGHRLTCSRPCSRTLHRLAASRDTRSDSGSQNHSRVITGARRAAQCSRRQLLGGGAALPQVRRARGEWRPKRGSPLASLSEVSRRARCAMLPGRHVCQVSPGGG